MASLAARRTHTVSPSWFNAVTGISRSVGGSLSSSLSQYRSYSNEGLEAGEQTVDGTLSGKVPLPVPKPRTIGVDKPVSDKTPYPPRNYKSPRGVYKAIVLGEVGQLPIQKVLKSGRCVTIFSVGTGGMYNNRRPFEGETPEEFAERSYTQWHRVAVYQDSVGSMVMQHVKVGSQVYLEGNIESRVFNDPNSGIVKRIREIAIRSHGRLMFMDTKMAKLPAQTPPAGQTPDPAPPAAAQAES